MVDLLQWHKEIFLVGLRLIPEASLSLEYQPVKKYKYTHRYCMFLLHPSAIDIVMSMLLNVGVSCNSILFYFYILPHLKANYCNFVSLTIHIHLVTTVCAARVAVPSYTCVDSACLPVSVLFAPHPFIPDLKTVST